MLKDEEGSGLSAEPSVSAPFDVPKGQGVVVVASDGLWDVCTPHEAVNIGATVYPHLGPNFEPRT